MVWQGYHQQGKNISYQKKQELLLPTVFFPRRRSCADPQSPNKVTRGKKGSSYPLQAVNTNWQKRDKLRNPLREMKRTRLLRCLYQSNRPDQHCTASFPLFSLRQRRTAVQAFFIPRRKLQLWVPVLFRSLEGFKSFLHKCRQTRTYCAYEGSLVLLHAASATSNYLDLLSFPFFS